MRWLLLIVVGLVIADGCTIRVRYTPPEPQQQEQSTQPPQQEPQRLDSPHRVDPYEWV